MMAKTIDGMTCLSKQAKVLEASQKGHEHYFKFLKECEDRSSDLMITTIRELGAVLGRKKRKVKSSDDDAD